MKAYFSKRHADVLRNKKLSLTFAKPLRVSILRILERHSDYGGWNNEENWTFEAAENSLKTFFGRAHLSSFNGQDQRVRSNFAGVVRGGLLTVQSYG